MVCRSHATDGWFHRQPFGTSLKHMFALDFPACVCVRVWGGKCLSWLLFAFQHAWCSLLTGGREHTKRGFQLHGSLYCHGFVKLTSRSSRDQDKNLQSKLERSLQCFVWKGNWLVLHFKTLRTPTSHTCNTWPPTLQESNSGQALCFRSPGEAILLLYWANAWFNSM